MDHGGHGDMDSGAMCNMNMLFTWNTENLCIVFPQWRITGAFSLLLSLVAVAAMTAGYELVRTLSRKYDQSSQEYANSLPRKVAADQQQRSKMVKAGFYAVQVFYSFFIMLLFMTYNGWVMLSVAVGAFIGHLAFGDDSGSKSVACH